MKKYYETAEAVFSAAYDTFSSVLSAPEDRETFSAKIAAFMHGFHKRGYIEATALYAGTHKEYIHINVAKSANGMYFLYDAVHTRNGEIDGKPSSNRPMYDLSEDSHTYPYNHNSKTDLYLHTHREAYVAKYGWEL